MATTNPKWPRRNTANLYKGLILHPFISASQILLSVLAMSEGFTIYELSDLTIVGSIDKKKDVYSFTVSPSDCESLS